MNCQGGPIVGRLPSRSGARRRFPSTVVRRTSASTPCPRYTTSRAAAARCVATDPAPISGPGDTAGNRAPARTTDHVVQVTAGIDVMDDRLVYVRRESQHGESTTGCTCKPARPVPAPPGSDNGPCVNVVGPMFPGILSPNRDYGDVDPAADRLDSTACSRRRRSASRARTSAWRTSAAGRPTAAATSRAIRPQAGGRPDRFGSGHVSHASTRRSALCGRCRAAHRWATVRSANLVAFIPNICPDRSHA